MHVFIKGDVGQVTKYRGSVYKANMQKKSNAHIYKKEKTTMSDDFKVKRRTIRAWPFQQDDVMCEDSHRRVRANWAFVVKK